MFSWSECELEVFLWQLGAKDHTFLDFGMFNKLIETLRYYNQILPLCDYLIFGYSAIWTKSTMKYSMILQQMEPIEEYPMTTGDFIVLMKSKSKSVNNI